MREMSIPPAVIEALARIELAQGDITAFAGDAIVNAANASLLGGGGVDGAIHRAAGPGLLDECRRLGGCPCGEARLTGGHGLKARHVIHTVGPVYRDGFRGEADLLASCHRRSLEIAADHGLERIAFPAISCGAYGYPVAEAAIVALRTCAGFLAGSEVPRRVTFVLFDARTLGVFQSALNELCGTGGS